MNVNLSELPAEVQLLVCKLKPKFGELFFLPEIGGRGLLLRNFTLAEHDCYILESKIDQDLADENLILKCVQWPPDFDLDSLPRNATKTILDKLNAVSPFDNPTRFFEKLQEKRLEVDTPKGQMCAYIVAAFQVPLEYVKKLHFDELMEHVAIAERVLGKTLQLTPEGQLHAVPEQSLSPAQLEQLHRRQRYERKRAEREKALEDYKLSRVGPRPHLDVPTEDLPSPPAPQPTRGSTQPGLLSDADELQRALLDGSAEL